MNYLPSEVEQMAADFAARQIEPRLTRQMEQRGGLPRLPRTLANNSSEGDGGYVNEDGEWQPFLRCGEVLDSAPLGP